MKGYLHVNIEFVFPVFHRWRSSGHRIVGRPQQLHAVPCREAPVDESKFRAPNPCNGVRPLFCYLYTLLVLPRICTIITFRFLVTRAFIEVPTCMVPTCIEVPTCISSSSEKKMVQVNSFLGTLVGALCLEHAKESCWWIIVLVFFLMVFAFQSFYWHFKTFVQ